MTQLIGNMTDPVFSARLSAEQLLHRPYFCSFERSAAKK